jgi:hypothetical protein
MTESTLLQLDAKRASDVPERSAASRAAPGQLKFGPDDDFYRELRKRVNEFFNRTGRKQRDCPQMYFKTATILAWFFGAYLLLLLAALSKTPADGVQPLETAVHTPAQQSLQRAVCASAHQDVLGKRVEHLARCDVGPERVL